MEILTTRAQLAAWRAACAEAGESVGFVPTMGALHVGHLHLVEQAQAGCERVVASIFVNPTQFGPNEDFGHYPRTFEADCQKLREQGCDALFFPDVTQIYPHGEGLRSRVVVPEALTNQLCGASRPGHFDGVATVVTILFQLVQPTRAYFGLKDYQQFQVIRQMVADLAMPLEVVGVETVREADGLAMSSRNRYLDEAARKQALALNQGLAQAQACYAAGAADEAALVAAVHESLSAAGITRIDYVAVRDAQTLEGWGADSERQPVVLIAAHVGQARLIDNRVLQRTL
uniref:Pantothenate synthetase n=1 Tax=Magnetococcus massalia (strain MO-1) TaxID=451514 RepID=A0A1S7LNG4_MAGMO|nr:Pantothenate synthetase [Candidatus Magnetococcus massalia]